MLYELKIHKVNPGESAWGIYRYEWYLYDLNGKLLNDHGADTFRGAKFAGKREMRKQTRHIPKKDVIFLLNGNGKIAK